MLMPIAGLQAGGLRGTFFLRICSPDSSPHIMACFVAHFYVVYARTIEYLHLCHVSSALVGMVAP